MHGLSPPCCSMIHPFIPMQSLTLQCKRHQHIQPIAATYPNTTTPNPNAKRQTPNFSPRLPKPCFHPSPSHSPSTSPPSPNHPLVIPVPINPHPTTRHLPLLSSCASCLAFDNVPSRHLLHEADVVVFRQVAVFLQIRPFVGGHASEEVLDELVGDEGVAEVDFGYVGLGRGVSGWWWKGGWWNGGWGVGGGGNIGEGGNGGEGGNKGGDIPCHQQLP